MTLREKQSAFAVLLARLILHAQHLGFQVTLGEVYRSPEEAARLAQAGKGITRSLHSDRLAADVMLFADTDKDGDLDYLTTTAAYLPLGVWWEAQSTPGIECCWGGRFARQDGNHFSVSHEGRK